METATSSKGANIAFDRAGERLLVILLGRVFTVPGEALSILKSI